MVRSLGLRTGRGARAIFRGVRSVVLGPQGFWDVEVWRRNRAVTKLFKAERKLGPKRSIVLVQLQKDPRLVLPSLYVATAVGRHAKARLVVFKATLVRESLFSRGIDWMWSRVGLLFQLGSLGVFGAIGARGFLRPNEGHWGARHEALLADLKGQIRAKDDVLDLCIDNVKVGDLFYDQLLNAGRPTIDLGSEWFWKEVRTLISLWLWWERIFDGKRVVGVVSTAPYLQGLPLRIAAKRELISIEPGLGALHTRRLSVETPRSRNESLNYRAEFQGLGQAEQELGITLGRQGLEKRILGGIGGPENRFANQWSRSQIGQHRAPVRSYERRRLVVAYCHEFTDSPNTYPNLFPDYWEWLTAIGEYADTKKFRWVAKPHPAGSKVSRDALDAFASTYPQIEVVSSHVSNAEFLEMGIGAAFTMYGSVGLELAYHNVPVVNASRNNPHISFDFNVNPQSKADFLRYVVNPELARPRVVLDDVYACYYMANIKNAFSYFCDFAQRDSELGETLWQQYVDTFDKPDHEKVLSKLEEFVSDGRYQLTWSSFGVATKMNRPRAN